ncbi:MAG: ATP-dependent RNA helicase HrpA [Planctomycetaceae bacterium]|jgi:ATP-dependent helicase HrpA|nr:ATP-dependent RNA helicase HrpA [Planctomycetaceae bacterium]
MQNNNKNYHNHNHKRFDVDFRRRLVESLSVQFDSELPVSSCRGIISEAILSNQVIVICGETGSGKSTQLPKICLEVGRGLRGIIGHTQPRRIAARSVAARIADELQVGFGDLVGYKVRFDEKTGQNVLIKLMTDGILLAESQTDRKFYNYDTIIIDEAHERSLNIDFLLGMMKRILPERHDLKLIITSATIDAQRFADHFSDGKINNGKPAPIIEVSGRSYPIEILYENFDEDKFDEIDNYSDDGNNNSGVETFDGKFNLNEFKNVSRETNLAEVSAIISAVDKLAKFGSGDILIFLPTERDIIETKIILERYCGACKNLLGQTEVLPLYSRLPESSQQLIFKKTPRRKIILSTNVAESSLTVPGIRYVIDTGKARISRYSPRTRTQRLPVEPVSQASADQRAGRCGRIGSGICIRLYSERDYLQRPRYTAPEILRTNLAAVILQTKALQLGEIERFPFIDPPQPAAIADGYKTLFEIGAIDAQNNLTSVGLKLSRFPVDPRIGRMILAASDNGVLGEMLIVAAALEIQDPRERPRDQQNKADAEHEKFLDPQSDFIGYLKLWDFYQNVKLKTSAGSLRKSCKQNFLSFNRMREWNDIYQQLQNYVKELGLKIPDRKVDFQEIYEPLHKSILSGELSGIAERSTNAEYNAAGGGNEGGGNNKFLIWPGSGVRKLRTAKSGGRNGQKNNGAETTENNRNENSDSNFDSNSQLTELPSWLVAVERVETERKYLRTAARINRNWIEPLAKHLIKRVYSDAFWDSATGYVYAYERATLFGLVLAARRRVNYGALAPELAGEIFLREALVAGDIDCDLEFIQYNKMLLEEAKGLRAKLRRADLLQSDEAIYEFYKKRIPAALVYDKHSLTKWVKSAKPDNLLMSMEDIFDCEVDAELFPDKIELGGLRAFELAYKFSPGDLDDGVTLIIQREELRQLDSAALGWLVPGMLERKLAALLKTLPKDIRRQIVPIPDTARAIINRLEIGSGDILTQLARETSRVAGRAVGVADFNIELLPQELLMNIRIVDANGEILGEGRNLDLLRRKFGSGEIINAGNNLAQNILVKNNLAQNNFAANNKVSNISKVDNINNVNNVNNVNVNNISGGGIGVIDSGWDRSGLMCWDFGDLPEFVVVARGRASIKMFPMICGDRLCLSDSFDKALSESRIGVVRLFYLLVKRDLRSQIRWLPDVDRMRVYAKSLNEFDFDEEFCMLAAARAIRIDELGVPRSEVMFAGRVKDATARLGDAVREVAKVIVPLLTEFQGARLAIESVINSRTRESCEEARVNLMRLVVGGFLLRTEWGMLREYPKFFKAVQIRCEKLRQGNDVIDRSNMRELGEYWRRYEERLELHLAAGIIDPQLSLFRWMLEEYRVSLFAQQLGTSIKVSPQRLEKQFEKIKK